MQSVPAAPYPFRIDIGKGQPGGIPPARNCSNRHAVRADISAQFLPNGLCGLGNPAHIGQTDTNVSHTKTTPQHSAAIPIMFTPRQAATTPIARARIPARGTCGAVMMAGKVITARVAYGT